MENECSNKGMYILKKGWKLNFYRMPTVFSQQLSEFGTVIFPILRWGK